MTLTTTLIVLSYNRPRMLREALASIGSQADEVILVDDGSDAFDVWAVACEHGLMGTTIVAPPVPSDVRVSAPRLGWLVNQALRAACGDVVGYLCDDDLLAPGWLRAAAAYLADHPSMPLVRGDWLQFRDGERPGDEACPLDRRGMTAGNFAHRRTLATERGVWWPTDRLTCHDDGFLWACHNDAGIDTFAAPHCGALAGWRRLHGKNLIHVTDRGALTPDAAAFVAGRME